MLDGGITDPIPLGFMESKGYDRNVVILTQPKGYVKKKSRGGKLMNLFLVKYPAIAKAMSERYITYNAQTEKVAKEEEEGKIFVLRPPESLGISRTESNPDELQRVYDIGRKTALKYLEDIRKFLG